MQPKFNTCPICGESFPFVAKHPDTLTCSSKCGAKLSVVNRPTEIRKCLHCEESFTTRPGYTNRYCSDECARLAGSDNKRFVRPLRSRVCPICGEDYLAGHDRKRCPKCCKCEWCGEQLKDSLDRSLRRFCNRSCASKYTAGLGRKPETQFKPGEIFIYTVCCYHCNRPYFAGSTRREFCPVCLDALGDDAPRALQERRLEYRIWRCTVYKQDNHTCVLCGAYRSSNNPLEAHHILPWRSHLGLRYDAANGVSLCRLCHNSLRWREMEFVERFQEYVKSRTPIELTDAERARLQRVEVHCSNCGEIIFVSRSKAKERLCFCRSKCRHEYRTTHPPLKPGPKVGSRRFKPKDQLTLF